MTDPFTGLATWYDSLHAAKEYGREAHIIHQEIMNRLVDFGCGTGEHLNWFRHQEVYGNLAGVDLSGSMLEIAQAKMKDVHFQKGGMECTEVALRPFDVVTCLFHSFGYLVYNFALEDALENFRKHLKPWGLLFLDVQNGTKTIKHFSGGKKTFTSNGFTKILEPVHMPKNQLVKNRYTFIPPMGRGRTFKEEHVMRYFFPAELTFMVESVGFAVSDILCPFVKGDDEDMLLIARKVPNGKR